MRRISRGVVALALAGFAAATPGRAADMAVPGYYPPQPQVYKPAIYDWTGIYVGGHIGAGWANDTVNWTTTTALLNGGTSLNVTPIGVVGGAQLGVNYEFTPWVVGAEASFTASGINGNRTVPVVAGATPITGVRMTSNPQWLVAATGRAGYAADTLLFYVKGGGAWMHVEYTQDTLNQGGAPPVPQPLLTSKVTNNRSGFTVGAGVEYGMTENFSAKAEYDFYDFGSANYTFTGITAAGANVIMPTTIKSDVHVFTVGLNYRLSWVGGWH